jgi:hypothetical protein
MEAEVEEERLLMGVQSLVWRHCSLLSSDWMHM